ncbi:hypothetical protein M9H77_13225 [Catharanthus roseus]|uniref:Uncharacterized protein n=1 Tax=Catharanthus roseus TaxID=4058 RepID=A0ACC0BJW8_CATRO|nr:hypothetical protein M9H77_13225 [Catharanthus roseus]
MKEKSISEDKRKKGQHVSEEKSREEKVKSDKNVSDQKKESSKEKKRRMEQDKYECINSDVSTNRNEGKSKEIEGLIENHESLKEGQVEGKKYEIEKSEETEEELSSILFQGDKREEVKKSCCNISSPLNSLSSEEVLQKFEAQKMENEGSVCYKLYKTISFLRSSYVLLLDFIINESNSCSFSIFCDRIQSQSFNFLTTSCGTNSNLGMKAKGEGIGKKLSIGYEDISISLSLNPFLLCMSYLLRN